MCHIETKSQHAAHKASKLSDTSLTSQQAHVFSVCVCLLPQDLALYNEFTISDTLVFFGRIHGLTSKETQARMDFLIDFLDLPQKNSLVRNLRLDRHFDSFSSPRWSGLCYTVESRFYSLETPVTSNINVHMQSNAIAISLRVLQRWQRSIENEATQLLEVAGVVTWAEFHLGGMVFAFMGWTAGLFQYGTV